jgi:hypothetical protein
MYDEEKIFKSGLSKSDFYYECIFDGAGYWIPVPKQLVVFT